MSKSMFTRGWTLIVAVVLLAASPVERLVPVSSLKFLSGFLCD